MCERDINRNNEIQNGCREVIPGLQLSHVGGDQAAPISTLCIELLEAETLHQFVENAGSANCIKPCPDTVKDRHEHLITFVIESLSGATQVGS